MGLVFILLVNNLEVIILYLHLSENLAVDQEVFLGGVHDLTNIL